MNEHEYHKTIQAYHNSLLQNEPKVSLESVNENEQSLDETLARLSNTTSSAQDRIGAILWLKAQALSDASFKQWRPQYLDGLRSASDSVDPDLRDLAFETLIGYGDSETQQRILDGLVDPSVAVIPAPFALRLLSLDAHSGAHEAARGYADSDTDEVTRLEALRVLASDPNSIERFAELLPDNSQSDDIRSLAATALSTLDRKRLKSVAESMTAAPDASLEAAPEALGERTDSNIEKHIRGLLDLPE